MDALLAELLAIYPWVDPQVLIRAFALACE
jgi:hypothetical protein